MLVRKSPDVPSSEITPKRLWCDRRQMLRLLGMATASVVVPSVYAETGPGRGKPLRVTSKMVTTTDALTPYDALTQYNNFYEFGIDKDDPARNARAFKPQPW